MISNNKFIHDAYRVQNFSNYFNIYTRVLTILTAALVILRGVMWRVGGFFNDMLFPYIRMTLLIGTFSLILMVPYILFILIKEKKYGWIIGLMLSVVIPMGVTLLLFKLKMFYIQSVFFPIILYSIYCYILNSEVKDWLSEYYAHQNRLEQKRLKEERIKNGLFD